MNSHAFNFTGEIIFRFCLSVLAAVFEQTCRFAGDLEPLLQCGEGGHEVDVRHRLNGAQQAIHNEEGSRSCKSLQPRRPEARTQAACVRHGAQRGANSAVTVSERFKSVNEILDWQQCFFRYVLDKGRVESTRPHRLLAAVQNQNSKPQRMRALSFKQLQLHYKVRGAFKL